MEEIIIRKAKIEEFQDILPTLAFRSFSNRFHNDNHIIQLDTIIKRNEGLSEELNETETQKLEFAGSLGIFPVLIPKTNGEGQSLEYFKKYWRSKQQAFIDNDFYTFVAEDLEGHLLGFIKGGYENVEPERAKLCTGTGENIKEFGSLYVDPAYRNAGLGQKLTQLAAQHLMNKFPECEGILTDCYFRNHSQYFVNKMGAVSVGFCNIPDGYLKLENNTLVDATQNITGEVMFWTKEQINVLINKNLINLARNERIGTVEKYTRNTLEYSKQLGKILDEFEKQNIYFINDK